MDRSAEGNTSCFDEYDLSLMTFFPLSPSSLSSKALCSSIKYLYSYTCNQARQATTVTSSLLFVVVRKARDGEKKSCEISIDEQIAKEIYMYNDDQSKLTCAYINVCCILYEYLPKHLVLYICVFLSLPFIFRLLSTGDD